MSFAENFTQNAKRLNLFKPARFTNQMRRLDRV